jgi:hypothetical protein
MKKFVVILIITIFAIGTCVSAQDLTSTHFIIRDPVVDTGGGFQSSASFNMYSAGNLNISGDNGSSATYKGRDGFLQYPLAQASPLSATVVGADIDTSWSATVVADGYTVSGYKIGISTTSGSSYTFTSLGSGTLSYNYIDELPGTYYMILQTLDSFGDVIATSSETSVTVQEVVTFAISANSVSFGPLVASGARYATTSGGSATPTSGNTISASSNASSGYSVSYDGSTLSSGANTISPATISGSSTGTPGTNQFALSLLSSGIASVPTTYDQTSSNWNFAQNTLTQIATTSGPTAVATLDAYYLANASTIAPSGAYSTVISYEMTANY